LKDKGRNMKRIGIVVTTAALGLAIFEPPRENWRLHSLRGWSDEQTRQVSG
jgi:hypothetical protein